MTYHCFLNKWQNRQSYTKLHVDANDSVKQSVKQSPVRTKGRGRGIPDPVAQSKEPITEVEVDKATAVRHMFKAFRVRFVRLNGILFTHTRYTVYHIDLFD